MFEITTTAIDADALKTRLANPTAGAMVTFEGWVRNHNEGQAVLSLEYEAFEAMCVVEAQKILEEAKARFEIVDVACVHRVGHLAIGDMAVWVGVVSAHRRAAFEACEFVIDEIKHRLPIWKKEHYVSGESAWVNCQQCAHPHSHHHQASVSAHEVFAAQRILPEVGEEGQELLKVAKVLVIGAGGLGSAVLPYLAAAGVGHIGICDGDDVQPSNLNRQVLYGPKDVGQLKARVAGHKLSHQFPFTQFEVLPQFATPKNLPQWVAAYDLVLDCTDTMEARLALSDAAVVAQKPLLSASVYQYEGQLFWYPGTPQAPCLRCLWPITPQLVTCSTHGALGAVVGLVGLHQAWEAVRFLLKIPSPLAQAPVLLLDYVQQQMTAMALLPTPDCPGCSLNSQSSVATKPVQATPVSVPSITPQQVSSQTGWQVVCLDSPMVQPHSWGSTPVVQIGYDEFIPNHPKLGPEPKIAFYCQHGVKSRLLVRRFQRLSQLKCAILTERS